MANSKITITFLFDFVNTQSVSFFRHLLSNPATKSQQLETFLDSGRTSNFTVPTVITVNPPFPVAASATAANYDTYFSIDHGGGGKYNVTRTNNVVEIELNSPDYGFSDFVATDNFATAVIANATFVTFSLVEAILSANTSPCGFYDLSVETDELAVKVYLNEVLIDGANTNNPFVIAVERGVDKRFKFENATGDILYYPVLTELPLNIPFLAPGNITVSVVSFINGATVTIDVVNVDGLILEYSLDNVTYQDDNIFTGQTAGTKFLYVRDQYNCVKSKEYTIEALGTRSPIAIISKANSIDFSKVEVWDGCSIFKNDENTLSCEGLAKFKHITDVLFQTCDDTTIQIKSNYEDVTAVLKDSDNVGSPLTVVKRSTNLNRFQKLDAKYYKFREGKLGLFFDTGDVYDEFDTVIGQYTLNGNLPEFAIIGQLVSIDTLGVFSIKDIVYDETLNKRVIIVDFTYEDASVDTKVESVYDILPYEIYEFSIDWSSFSVGEYSVTVTNTDTINGTVSHQSERIKLAVTHPETLAIDYSNENNRDIFYKYGIKHFIRVPFVRFLAKQKDENEINITDDNAVVVESTVYEMNEIKFDVLSGSLMRKLIVALSSENLFINGTGYVKDGNADSENIENTNLHEVSVSLIKTNVSFTNFKQGITGVETEVGEFDTPQIITTGTNFIKA